jgi:DNA-binding GntR family transcriptional regulator
MLTLGSRGARPAQKQSRSSGIYAGLRDAIFAHRLTPGTKLPEDELASIYAVSRTVVRSALQALAHDRLVRLELNRGAFVAQPSQTEAREIFDMRILVEPRAAALAAGRATAADERRLRLHLEEEHAAMREGRDSEALMLSARFHVLVAEIAGHAILCEFVTDLVMRSSLIIALYWSRRDTLCASHAHVPLLEAIARNKPEKAAELMARHLADLLSELDLTPSDVKPRSLADILR